MSGSNARGRRLLVIAGIVLLIALLAVPAALAFEGREGDVVVIEADEVIDDDLYVGAGEFTLDGTVKGDLIVGGNTININGTVEGDLWAAGQTIIVNGTVADDARIAGYSLIVGGDVADDFLAAGFSLEQESESAVGGDLVYGGYQALLEGGVEENVVVAGGAVQVAGSVGGDATVDVSGAEPGQEMPPGFPFFGPPGVPPVPSVPAGLTIDNSASIGGDLNYTANAKIDVPSGAVAGDVDFTQYVPDVEPQKAPSPAAVVGKWFVSQARRLITLLLVGALMMWVVPSWTRKLSGIVRAKPLPSLGWGIVSIAAFVVLMIVLVIATVLLAIIFGVVSLGELGGRLATLGGLTIGAAGFSFSVIWAYVTKIVISLLLGQLIFRLFKSTAAEHRWWPMLLGVVIFVIIAAIPVLGWLARLLAVLFGLGAVWLWGRDWLQSRKAAPVVVEEETPDASPSQ
jgi:cytoskeletal protein CcmA (bactofilin family)